MTRRNTKLNRQNGGGYIFPETVVIELVTSALCLNVVSQGNGTTDNYTEETLDWDD